MTNKFLKIKAFIPFKKQYKIHGEGEQLLPHSCTATKSMEKLFVENCRAIYVLTDHVLCSNFFHISSSSSSKNCVNNFFQVLELASKIKPQERPSSSPSETWRKKSLCASSCRFWKHLSSFDSTKQAAILKLNNMVFDCIISFTIWWVPVFNKNKLLECVIPAKVG